MTDKTLESQVLEVLHRMRYRNHNPDQDCDCEMCRITVEAIAEIEKVFREVPDDPRHPYRWSALEIIWEVLEPLLGSETIDDKYYGLEDRITEVIQGNCSNPPSVQSASEPEENPAA